MGYERATITRLTPYTPGEQPRTAEPVKLNTNENPYPPTEPVLRAIRAIDAESLRRYPPPTAAPFRRLAAETHGLAEDQVIATHGGDELLRLAITVFTDPSGPSNGLGLTEPSYSLYQVLARIHGCAMTTVKRHADFSLPPDLADQWNAAGCNLAMLVNPHAPSGRLESEASLRQIAERFNGVLVIDEAYVDFAEHDALNLLRGDDSLDNVLLLRSLSKGYSLAGLRFGYGMGHSDLIAALDKARDSYNLDAVAQAGAVAALKHRDQARQSWQRVIDERQRLSMALWKMGFTVLNSQTNFLLVTPPTDGLDAAELYESLKQQAIYVRYFNQAGLADKLRITVGRPEENETLLTAIRELITAPTG